MRCSFTLRTSQTRIDNISLFIDFLHSFRQQPALYHRARRTDSTMLLHTRRYTRSCTFVHKQRHCRDDGQPRRRRELCVRTTNG